MALELCCLKVISWACLVLCGAHWLVGDPWMWGLRSHSSPLVPCQRPPGRGRTGTPRPQEDKGGGGIGATGLFFIRVFYRAELLGSRL